MISFSSLYSKLILAVALICTGVYIEQVDAGMTALLY